MDLEAIQLLNLSPIPELSELELSTMLDHLSGLSDVNGDLTDRNVEDILREAEDLLDISTRSKTHESKSVSNTPKAEEKVLNFINPYDLKNYEEHNNQHLECENKHESKHNNTPIKSDDHGSSDIYIDNNDNKHYNSPVGNKSSEIYSPGGSCNHIKSAIDSLKEFSAIIEQTLSSKSSNSSSKSGQITKLNEKESQKDITTSNSQLNKKTVSSKQVTDCSKTVKVPDFTKKNVSEPLEKSVKLLNCFERLYQARPIRLSVNKKPKNTDKVPKTPVKKKLSKDLKNIKKNSWQGRTVQRKTIKDVKVDSKIYDEMNDSLLSETSRDEWDLLKFDKTSSQYPVISDQEVFLPRKRTGKKTEDELLRQGSLSEKLALRILEGVEEMKDQVKKVGVFPEKIMKENQKDVDDLKPEMDSVGEKFTLEMEKSAAIKKLEEKFSNLKDKYYHQIEKLETENLRLREALNNQSKILAAQISANTEIFKVTDVILPTEAISYKASLLSSSSSCIAEKKIMQSTSLEKSKTPENSLCPSPENVHPSKNSKEAFTQTEKELKTASVQCSQECKPECKDIGTDGNAEIISEARKAEDKENLGLKKKLGKSKPFSDVNVHQLIQKQKKTFDHETQLLATIRGLQTEMNVKDKENRKMKTEMDSLRRQIKRLTQNKVENCRKCNIGTQTLGLGLFVQKPYNPEYYEVPQELESENDELRSRIKALEEDFELLKEKRISDLQSLHQVHEEEMAKLVSKLETQSALTRHLHSLLVNR